MLPQNNPDRIRIVFDDHRLVANAGLLLPGTLARHLDLGELVDHHLDLGGAPGRANRGDKMLTLVAFALAGGDCIDDADALRAGGTACTLGGTVKAPSTLGTFLRSFRWSHVRQLDRVSRELLAWAAGAGPGDAPFTIDLDSTIYETYGLAKLDFAQFKRRKPGNRQVGGTERPGLSVYQGRRRTVKNPPTPATGGGAPERWHPRRSATVWRTKPLCDGPRVVVAAEDGPPGWSRRRAPSGLA